MRKLTKGLPCIDCGKKKITNWDRDEHFPYPENNWRR